MAEIEGVIGHHSQPFTQNHNLVHRNANFKLTSLFALYFSLLIHNYGAYLVKPACRKHRTSCYISMVHAQMHHSSI